MAEDVLLNNKRYIYTNEVRGHAKTRHSFMELAKRVYGLDFTTWYCRGYWQDSYLPHVLLDGENVVANVSVNLIRTFWNKEEKLYTQLGTVMTDEPYRKNGLSGFLLHKIIGQWENHCDAVYLYANDSVLSFYPKFGFVSADEFQCQNEVQPKRGSLRKLDINREEDKELLLELYRFSNPYSRLPMLHNEGLLMFYCSQFMRDHVYYIEDFDAVAILDYQGETMICYDIYSAVKGDLADMLAKMADKETKAAVLGFTPHDTSGFKVNKLQEEDTTLFILQHKENIFKDNQLMFPLLSRA